MIFLSNFGIFLEIDQFLFEDNKKKAVSKIYFKEIVNRTEGEQVYLKIHLMN